MDPDETLSLARSAVAHGEYIEAAAFYETLDEWLSRGGFKPRDWE